MGIGKIDSEFAVREGWARDSDDEIYMDGYNAFIQVTTRDGTSGFSVKNDIGAIAFSSKSDGDGYVAKNLGVGTYNPETKLEVIGKTRTDQLQVTENAASGYVLTSDTNGNATWQEAGAGADTRVKVSSNDTTTDYLSNKLVAGENITITEQNDGGNETLRIDASGESADLDGYLNEDSHRDLDQLVHVISEDSYEEMTYSNNDVTNITVWTDSDKTTKIREQQFVYGGSGNRISQITTIQYDNNGIEVEREVESFTHDSNGKIVNISRTLSFS